MPSDSQSMDDYQLLPFEMGYLPDYFVEKAKLELNESAVTRENALKEMRRLIANDKSLAGFNREDELLLQFLRARKFNAQRAFANLKVSINFRLKYTALFTDIHFKNMRKAADQGCIHILPYRCHEGCPIIIFQISYWDPEDFRIEDFRRFIPLMFLEAMKDVMTQVNGYKIIFDVNTNAVRHIRQCSPYNLFLFYHGTQDCIPGRLKGIHFVNQSPILKVSWMILKHLMSEKFKKRTVFHSDPKTLLNYFPKSVLPEKYGGDLKKYDTVDYIRKAATPENIERLFSLKAK